MEEKMELAGDHSTIIKFTHQEAEGYTSTVHHMRRWLRDVRNMQQPQACPLTHTREHTLIGTVNQPPMPMPRALEWSEQRPDEFLETPSGRCRSTPECVE